jgi:hypothetical protein
LDLDEEAAVRESSPQVCIQIRMEAGPGRTVNRLVHDLPDGWVVNRNLTCFVDPMKYGAPPAPYNRETTMNDCFDRYCSWLRFATAMIKKVKVPGKNPGTFVTGYDKYPWQRLVIRGIRNKNVGRPSSGSAGRAPSQS